MRRERFGEHRSQSYRRFRASLFQCPHCRGTEVVELAVGPFHRRDVEPVVRADARPDRARSGRDAGRAPRRPRRPRRGGKARTAGSSRAAGAGPGRGRRGSRRSTTSRRAHRRDRPRRVPATPATAATSASANPPWNTDRALQHRPLGVAQQVVRPLHRGFEGGLPLARSTLAARQEPEPIVEAIAELGEVDAAGPGRRRARSRAGSRRVARRCRRRSPAIASSSAMTAPAAVARLDEQLDAGRVRAGRERRDLPGVLAVDLERLTARRQHPQLRAASEELVEQLAPRRRSRARSCRPPAARRAARGTPRSGPISRCPVVERELERGRERAGDRRRRRRSRRDRRTTRRRDGSGTS